MYSLIKFAENVIKFIRIKCKILYWKIKYGKNIKIGKNLTFKKGFIINMTKNGKLTIGDNCGFNNNCSINCHKEIVIGHDNIFGENVKIYDHNHIFNDKSIDFKRNFSERKITIGNRNWFGSNVIILKNADIGNDNVIAAATCINEKVENEYIVKNKMRDEIETVKIVPRVND